MHSLPSSRSGASRLASRLGVPMREIALHRFPDGELLVTVGPAAPTTILYASLDQPNDKLISLLFAAEALRRNGTERLILVAPYLCYMRQDAAFQAGQAISQKVVGRMLAGIFDRVLTVDAHLHRTESIQSVFPHIEADNLSAMPAIANVLLTPGFDRRTVIVGPDAESQPWVSDLAGRLGVIHAVAQKVRRDDRSVEVRFIDPQLLAGRPVLLVDDIVSSGGTLIACAKALAAAGAASIDAIVTHALFSPGSTDDFVRSGIRSIRSTHSVPHPTNAIGLDEVLATALRNEVVGAPMRESTS
jgi:ribose-phosphate pyrophosphokinase